MLEIHFIFTEYEDALDHYNSSSCTIGTESHSEVDLESDPEAYFIAKHAELLYSNVVVSRLESHQFGVSCVWTIALQVN